MDYHRMHRLNIRIVRIFNTYGPRMHPYDGRVVSNFIRQALHNEDITVFGGGDQTRSFCYRDDLIEGMLRMMDATDSCVGPINHGNPDEFTILELAQQVIELTGSKSKIVHRDLPVDDPKQRQPDITLAKRHLDWSPRTSLREGLEKTIAWFRTIRWDEYRAPTPNY
jgi:UDP-glucuronate decarboxylase